MNMKTKSKTYWILVAAVAGLPFMGTAAFGQQRVGSDGHALDANNRIGSGGTNTPTGTQAQSTQLNNQIVTNNVTGLSGFQGKLGYTDPGSFRIANLPGSGIERFNAISGGVPGAGAGANYGGNTPTPFYGYSSTAAPPPGYSPTPINTGYVPTPPVTGPLQGDPRLDYSLSGSTLIAPLPLPGELLLPGPVDPTGGLTISTSPEYGVREWHASEAGDRLYMFNRSGDGPVGPEDWATPTQNRIDEIRREVNRNLIPDISAPGASTGQGSDTTGGAPGLARPLPPLTVDRATPILSSNLAATAGNMSTDQSTRRYLGAGAAPAPGQTSALYQQLKTNLTAYDSAHPMTDEEANRKFLAMVREQRLLAAKAGGAGQQVKPGGTATAPVNPGQQGEVKPAPVHVGTLAAGVRARGLADVLTHAEDAIRKGQFAKAIDDYNEAAQVTPNNALILVGRAHAELAGSYYRQAEADLRTAFAADHAVLLAQFDLNDLLGARLPYIVSELKQIASDSPENATPVFLLSYISYNTGNQVKALGYLDAADKRTGGNDAVIGLMKKYWTFTETPKAPTTQPDMNK
jgi:hypothetical protein